MRKLIIGTIFTGMAAAACAQDTDLDKLLDQETNKTKQPETQYTISTFKGTRIANGHSVETLPGGVLDFKVSHRFGFMSAGISEFFGLDNAITRIGFDYGITDRLMVGIGRSGYQKQADGFAKWKILRQSTGKRNMPVSLVAMASMMARTASDPKDVPYKFHRTDRLSYAMQVMVSRKFNDAISLQFMPTLVHYNLVPKASDPNDVLSLGFGGSFKVTKRTRISAEYYFNLPGHRFDGTKNSMCISYDIETGGHVFQLIFTNSQGMAERPFITETTGDFFKGDISFGFNISRVFQVAKKKKKNV